MTVAEKVIAALANLPDEQQTIVLDFVESLNQKQQAAIASQGPSPKTALEIFSESGFIGCVEADENLSVNLQPQPTILERMGGYPETLLQSSVDLSDRDVRKAEVLRQVQIRHDHS